MDYRPRSALQAFDQNQLYDAYSHKLRIPASKKAQFATALSIIT